MVTTAEYAHMHHQRVSIFIQHSVYKAFRVSRVLFIVLDHNFAHELVSRNVVPLDDFSIRSTASFELG